MHSLLVLISPYVFLLVFFFSASVAHHSFFLTPRVTCWVLCGLISAQIGVLNKIFFRNKKELCFDGRGEILHKPQNRE